jgi:hypothetical protein
VATSKSKLDPGIVHGYRSGLEEKVAEQLSAAGLSVQYEAVKIKYVKPQKKSLYTPDFVLPNGIVIETKGRFLTADRQKHKFIKDQYPDIDIRFVFSRASSRLTKTSQTSYANWCEQYGFQWADKLIPKAWLVEPSCPKRHQALKEALK